MHIEMANIYLPSMFVVLILGHYGINNKVQSRALVGLTLVLIFTLLFGIAGFRTGIGDTVFYKHSYELVGDQIEAAKGEAIQWGFDGEKGFNYLVVLLNYIDEDPQLLVAVMAFITNLFYLTAIYKYGRPFELSIYLYFATVIYYISMNGMRQAFVASIFFWGIQFIIQGRLKAYLLMIALLFQFHNSALVLIPIYFVARQKAWGKFFYAIAGLGVAAATAFRPLMPVIIRFLENTSYDEYATDMATSDAGVNMIRVAVMVVPLVLAYLVKDDLEAQWKEGSVFIFLSLINFIFMLLGSQYLYFYRVCIYFEPANLILIPRIISVLKGKIAKCAYVFLILFYGLFCYYQVAMCWGESYRNILFMK